MGKVFVVVSMFIAQLAHASALCDELSPSALTGRWALAPLKCEAQNVCDQFRKELLDCLSKNKIQITTDEGTKAAGQEQVFAQLLAGESSDKLVKFAEKLDVQYLALAEFTAAANAGLLRVVRVSDGSVARIVRYRPGSTKPSETEESVSEALSRLTAKLAASYAALGAQSKGKRLAVLNFQEHGEVRHKNARGTVVSAELVTRFRRDYSLAIVERSRLEAVLKELELGQTGFVDDKVAPKLGKLLEASVLVLGSVNDAGSTIRINAQMIDVSTGATIVADGVELKSANLVALSSDAVVLRSKSGAVFRSLLIPGWGQFYNRQPIKGGAIIGVAAGLAGAAITCEILAVVAESTYERARSGNFDAMIQQVDNFALARDILLGALAAVWIYNIIDAYASGVTFDSAVGTAVGGSSVAITPVGFFGRF